MCVALVAQQNPVAFHRQGETLVKPLLKGMTHQHSKVRVESLKVRRYWYEVGCFMQQQVWMRSPLINLELRTPPARNWGEGQIATNYRTINICLLIPGE